VLGLVDDFWNLSPIVKLLGLFPAILVMIFSGVGVSVFSWDWLNAVVSFLWMLGITNAFNLLDNMDGLAGGIGLVILGFLVYFFAKDGNAIYLSFTVGVMGAVLGFWILNVPPASIFMGDSGSLCLGLTLAALSISRKSYPSHSLIVVGTSLFLFFVPIFDTAMVVITRYLRGQSPLQGGVDHTSHRLVAMGLSERQTMMVIMLITLVLGLCAVVLESRAF
jgi:UDP-GlcNAc:undecaprenyl-phosphate GlcNAc-1-phosphate transferase